MQLTSKEKRKKFLPPGSEALREKIIYFHHLLVCIAA